MVDDPDHGPSEPADLPVPAALTQKWPAPTGLVGTPCATTLVGS
jgi:hypothetical protein